MALEIKDLGEMIRDRRGTRGVRAAAGEIGISHATLSRIENGHVPDLTTFAAICEWLDEDPAKFFGKQIPEKSASTASVHMRKSKTKTTSVDTAIALGDMIMKAQEALRNREELL